MPCRMQIRQTLRRMKTRRGDHWRMNAKEPGRNPRLFAWGGGGWKPKRGSRLHCIERQTRAGSRRSLCRELQLKYWRQQSAICLASDVSGRHVGTDTINPGGIYRMNEPLGILIGGTSHVGKSTFAKMVALALGRDLISTDDLARHPGRPWPTVRAEVAEYYSNLSDETIHWFLKVHHENLWPRIEHIIDVHRQAAKPFVLEGAALRPEYMARIETGVVLPLLLHCSDALLRKRLIEGSRLEDADEATSALIGKFIKRSLRDNDDLLDAARKMQIRCIDVGVPGAIDTLAKELRDALSARS